MKIESVLAAALLLLLAGCGGPAADVAAGNYDALNRRASELGDRVRGGGGLTVSEKSWLRALYGAIADEQVRRGLAEGRALKRYLEGSGGILAGNPADVLTNRLVRETVSALKKQLLMEMIRKKEIVTNSSAVRKDGIDPPLSGFFREFRLKAEAVRVSDRTIDMNYRLELSGSFLPYGVQKSKYGDGRHFRTCFLTNGRDGALFADDGLTHYLAEAGLAGDFVFLCLWSETARINFLSDICMESGR